MENVNRERIEHELKTCRTLESSWQKRADQFYGKSGCEKEYAGAVNRSGVYGIMVERLKKILDQWEEEGDDRK